MQAKLALDYAAFGSDHETFAYVYTRLEGTAQNMAAAYFEQGVQQGTRTAVQFLEYLNQRYGDPNATARALDRLRNLRQKPGESFMSFFPKFEKELADSGGGSWSDDVQINYLSGTLNDSLEDRLISIPVLPTDFNKYTELLMTISSRLDSQSFQQRSQQKSQQKSQQGSQQRSQQRSQSQERL